MAGGKMKTPGSSPFLARKGAMQPLWAVTTWLCVVWVVSLFYGELIAFWLPMWTCLWPSLSRDSTVLSNATIKVAVIADPQLTDRTTHGMKTGSFALKATQFYSDIFMRRAFRTTVLSLKPDAIIFLGDYLDGGPFLSNAEYKESLKRFWHIFDQSGMRARIHADIPFYFLSGNHDLGYAGFVSERPEVLKRHVSAFGAVEHMARIGAVDFVFVDAQSLDGSSIDAKTRSSWRFVENVSSEIYTTYPKVLLSHVPLYRPDNTPCGVLRSSEVINQRIIWSRSGLPKIVYQNYLSEDTTVRLLDLLKPVLVLSGHDHDQCTLKHRTPSLSVIEHTVGSFSWQNGNLFPSFLLLSVSNASANSEDGILSSQLCFLPYQTFIYVWYAILFGFSLVALLIWPSQGIEWNLQGILLYPVRTFLSRNHQGVKEKEEDANYEYEVMWDAEGSMHLIRKVAARSGSRDSGNENALRATAVSQSVVRRMPAVETPSITIMPTVAEPKSEGSVGSSGRQPKTFLDIILRKINQVTGPIVVLASVNVGLYVILMVNDWMGV